MAPLREHDALSWNDAKELWRTESLAAKRPEKLTSAAGQSFDQCLVPGVTDSRDDSTIATDYLTRSCPERTNLPYYYGGKFLHAWQLDNRPKNTPTGIRRVQSTNIYRVCRIFLNCWRAVERRSHVREDCMASKCRLGENIWPIKSMRSVWDWGQHNSEPWAKRHEIYNFIASLQSVVRCCSVCKRLSTKMCECSISACLFFPAHVVHPRWQQ